MGKRRDYRQLMQPTYYTVEEGGLWKPWPLGPLMRSVLDQKIPSGKRVRLRVPALAVDVFALLFGHWQPSTQYGAHNRIWDCLYGWRDVSGFAFWMRQPAKAALPPEPTPEPYWDTDTAGQTIANALMANTRGWDKKALTD